jgi:hypothetical protein
VSSSDAITPLPLDPELLGELREKVPGAVIEQLTDNWQKQTEALARRKEHPDGCHMLLNASPAYFAL